MPRAFKLESFPPEYELLLLRGATDPGGFVLLLQSAKQATAMRHKFYAYLKTLRESTGIPREVLHAANSVVLKVDGPALHLLPNRDTWDAGAIRDALGLEKWQIQGKSGEIAAAEAQINIDMRERLRLLRLGKEK